MGKADVNVNIWLSEKKRFANLFNGVIYGGRQVILPEDLEEVNPVSSVSVKNRTGKTKNMKKYRDIIMKWRNQATLVLLANESQDKVHYAMPHKVMLYDGMDYETQIRNNWKNFNDRRKQNKKAGQSLEHLTAGEYLSRFRKKDRLIPIILVQNRGMDLLICMICFGWKERKKRKKFWRNIFPIIKSIL